MKKPTIPPSASSTNGEEEDFPFGANPPPASRRARSQPLPDSDEAAQPEPTSTPATVEPESTPAAPDPFSVEALRLPQNYQAALGVKKILLTVPVKKPDKAWFVRVHPDPAYRLQTAVVDLKAERETYLVAPALWPDLAAETTFRPQLLATAMSRQGVLFLWPSNLPRDDGRADPWAETSLAAIERAIRSWVRIQANMQLGAYDVIEAAGSLGEPSWPDTPFGELLKIAFKGRFIDTADHPVLRRLRGEL